MKKYIIALILTTLLYSLFTPKIFADETSYQWPSGGVFTGSSSTPTGAWSDLQTQDTNYVVWTSQTAEYVIGDTWSSFSLPSDAWIEEFITEFRIKTSTSGWSFWSEFSINSGTNYYKPTSNCNLTAYGTESYGCQYNSLNNTFDTAHLSTTVRNGVPAWRGSDINTAITNGTFRVKLYQSGGSKTVTTDYIRVKIKYSVPYASIYVATSSASPSTGKVTMDLSGDFNLPSISNRDVCLIGFYSLCDGVRSKTSVARARFVAGDGRTTTENTGGTSYLGHGISTGDSTWELEDLVMPYVAGATCTYPTSWSCSDEDGVIVGEGQSLSSQYANYDSQFTASPSATIATDANTQPDCGLDLVCAFQTWLRSLFEEVFIVDSNTPILYDYQDLLDQLYSRAPFAYIVPIFDLDTSSITDDQSFPTLTIPFDAGNAGFGNSIVYEADSNLAFAVSLTRPAFQVLIWVTFLIYLIVANRRVLNPVK